MFDRTSGLQANDLVTQARLPEKMRPSLPGFEILARALSRISPVREVDIPFVSPLIHWLDYSWKRVWQSRVIERFGRAIEVDLAGFKMKLELTTLHDALVFGDVRRYGLYDRATALALSDRLRTGDTFIDVGANNGFFSLFAAVRVGVRGSVLAFEPNPASYRRLQSNVNLNGMEGLVHAFLLGASNHDGTEVLLVSGRDDGLSTLRRSSGLVGEAVDKVRVRVAKLDDVISSRPARVVCKIDVEGHEGEVLDGMKGIIDSAKELTLVIEWNRSYSGEELWKRVCNLGDVFEIQPGGNGYSLARLHKYSDTFQIARVSNLLVESRRQLARP